MKTMMPHREEDFETSLSETAKSIGAGIFTLAFLGGIGYLLYIALFNVS